jgi:RinA family phage transcriptional activator
MKIPRAVFRYIEHELYNYESSKRQLEELREDILSKAERPIEVIKIGGGGSKPTGRDITSETGMELVTNSALVRLSRRIIEIEDGLRHLSLTHQQLFKLKYCEGREWSEICASLHIEQSAYYKYRREMIMAVATKMALV